MDTSSEHVSMIFFAMLLVVVTLTWALPKAVQFWLILVCAFVAFGHTGFRCMKHGLDTIAQAEISLASVWLGIGLLWHIALARKKKQASVPPTEKPTA